MSASERARSGLRWLGAALLIYVLFVAVGLVAHGFAAAIGTQVVRLFEFATNPMLGLVVGILATALVQSSSTVTSIIVGLVAGGLPVVIAVPMVMGANVGTTITNTLVSLGHVANRDEFRRAFAAATVHDFFNILSIVIFLPTELALHLLEHVALTLGQLLVGGGERQSAMFNFLSATTNPAIGVLEKLAGLLPHPYDGVLMIVVGVVLVLLAISLLGRLLRSLMVGRAERVMHAAIGRGPVAGVAAGALVTVAVQSSSTTTSLMVPLAGAGLFSLWQVYRFTLGANIGTCITALLAAFAVSGPQALPALQIALVQLLYNLFGVAVIYGIPLLARMPVLAAEHLAGVVSERKALGIAYVAGVFFGVPGALLALTSAF